MVTLGSVARFLAQFGVHEPRCRAILAVAREHASPNGKLAYGDVGGRQIMAELEPAFRVYVGDSMNQMQMMQDMSRGGCVILAQSLVAFVEHVLDRGMTRRQAKRLVRRVRWYNDGASIIVENWRILFPQSLIGELHKFLGIPQEVNDEDLYGPPPSIESIGNDTVIWAPEDTDGWFPYGQMDSGTQLASMFSEHTGEDIAQ